MKRLLLILSCCIAFGCQPDQPQAQSQVTPEEATAYTNNVTTQIEVNPLTKNYYLVLDSSGSMKGDRLAIAKKAVRKFVSIIPSDANIGMLNFGGRVYEQVKLTKDREVVISALDSISAGGGTPLATAMNTSYSALKSQFKKQFEYGEYHMIVLTDGDASGKEDPSGSVSVISKDGWCTIHTIGFQIEDNHSLNSPDKVLYQSAQNYQELEQGFQSVLAEAESFDISFN